MLIEGAAQLTGDFHPMLGVGGQLFGIQRVAFAPGALGLEQRGIGVAQQLLGAQGVTGEQADTDTGADKQLVAVKNERILHGVEHALRQGRRLHHLRAAFCQHGKFVAPQARQGNPRPKQAAEAFGHQFEQLIANVMAEAVVDDLEVVQVHQQQGAATLMHLRGSQGLLGAIGEQQAVGQVGERVVMGQVRQFVLGVLHGADVRKHRHVVADLALVIVNHADGLPLGVHLAAFTSVPDFAAPFAGAFQGLEHLLVEMRRVAPGLEQAWPLAHHVVALVAGDLHKRAVDVHDQPLGIGDQHPFAGAIEHRSGLAQALAVLFQGLLQRMGTGKTPAYPVDDQGAEADPHITARLQPTSQLQGFIDKVD